MTPPEFEARLAVLEIAVNAILGDVRVRMAKIMEQNELLIRDLGECKKLLDKMTKDRDR